MQAPKLAAPADATQTTPPRIGAEWPGQGGIYAGIMRGRDGGPDYHLIVGPALGTLTWEKSKAAAADVEVDGHKDFTLPFRKEQSLQFANVSELFERDWHWSGESHASDSVFAWFQYFDDGSQDYGYVYDELCARAVRRLPIQ